MGKSSECLSYVSCTISSIHVSLGRDESEMLFELVSLIPPGLWRASALATSYQAPSSPTLMQWNFSGCLVHGNLSQLHDFANADPSLWIALPVLSSIFFLPGTSRFSHPSSTLSLPFAHTTGRESFQWCYSSLFICLPFPLDSDFLEEKQWIFPSA